MSQVYLSMAMSLDGFVTGPQDDDKNPAGVKFEVVRQKSTGKFLRRLTAKGHGDDGYGPDSDARALSRQLGGRCGNVAAREVCRAAGYRPVPAMAEEHQLGFVSARSASVRVAVATNEG